MKNTKKPCIYVYKMFEKKTEIDIVIYRILATQKCLNVTFITY